METSKLVSIARREAASDNKIKPNAMGMAILEKHQIVTDGSGGNYYYTGAYWREMSEDTLLHLAHNADCEQHTTHARRRETVSFIRAHSHIEQIKWRDLQLTEIPFANGVFDLATEKLRPHRPEDYLEAVLPHDWAGEIHECPEWESALHTYWGADPDFDQKCAALQEFMGYCLMPHARYKKALILQGNSDTGKSLVADVIERMVGQSNCCCVSVEDMDDSTERTQLIGKMVNKITEISSRAVIADGGFKTLISTEESIGMRPLYRNPFNYTPIAKHVFACNELPVVSDRSEGTFNRMLILRFNRVLTKDEQDRALMDRLTNEIVAITHWALAGARRLLANRGMFTEVPDCAEALKEYRASQNEIVDFISEKCAADIDGEIPFSEFFERFCNWSRSNKHTRHSVSRMLKQAGHASVVRWDGNQGRTRRIVAGIYWQPGAYS